jgi:parallel beta-helix repeat protein
MRKASETTATATDATPTSDADRQEGVQRRDLVSALLGLVGVGAAASALQACGTTRGDDSGPEGPVARASQASATGTSFVWFDTIYGTTPNLKNSNGTTAYQVAICDGYAGAGDGGGGIFWWDTSSTTGDDGGTVIVPNSPTGRWKRIYSGALDIRWFGATPGNPALDNSTAINAAINAAIATGGPGAVFVPAGTFYTKSPIVVQSSAANPLRIYGTGYASVINATTSAAFENGLSTTPISYLAITDLQITGAFSFGIALSVSGNAQGSCCTTALPPPTPPPSSSHVYVMRCFISGATVGSLCAGIYILGIDDVWIVDNELTGNGTAGVPSTFDIVKYAEGAGAPVRWRIHIRNNRIFNSATSICIGVFDANDSDVVGNSVCQSNTSPGSEATGGYGIMFHSGNIPILYRNIVSNNSVSRTWGMGIYLSGSYDSIVSSNTVCVTCTGTSGPGISPSSLPCGAISMNGSNNSVVDGNIITTDPQWTGPSPQNALAGIIVAAASGSGVDVLGNTIVSNNYIEDTGTSGLSVVSSGSSSTCSDCYNNLVFSGNVVNNAANQRGSGFFAYGNGLNLDGIRIIGNSFYRGSGDGIAIGGDSMTGGSLTNSTISGNYVYGFVAQGIIVGLGSHVALTGNTVVGLGTTHSAVGIDFRASNSVVELNAVTTCSGGISCTGAQCRIGSNTLDGCGTPIVSIGGSNNYGENNRLSASGPMRGTVTLADAACGGGTPSCGVAYTSEVLAGDTVRLNRVVQGGTLGHLYYDVTAGAYIRVWSTSNAETSVVEWEIVH